MKRSQPKVIESKYFIKVNGTVVCECDSLSQARKEVKQLPLTSDVEEVAITRRTLTETVINKFKPEVTRTLSVDELFD